MIIKPYSAEQARMLSPLQLAFIGDSIWENLNEEEIPNVLGVVRIENYDLLISRSKELTHAREHLNELFGKKFPNRFEREMISYYHANQPDELAGVRAINIIAMKKAIFLQETFGQDSALARELLERLLKIEITAQTSKQVLGLKYFATGLAEEDKAKLTEGGAKGMSTFLGYYILKAVASFDKEKAVAMMKEYYGAMLDKGATTFWEDFDMEWTKNSGRIDAFPEENQRDIHGDFGAYCYKGFRHSLCHGWSAGVIGFLKEEL